ncbi:ABC transporter substrate-binding protein [Clostridium bovifaecis]|uniref:ABC transporter substrate-binding protein n=1 Tax=Clostridium bovifaecis TaxID=2184719 RepID=A0A6I6EXS2_9CLOT|nr:ABC transporter substrate-binding protein [Clostridium bovifaecis]
MYRKIIALITVFIITFSLSACNNKKTNEVNNSEGEKIDVVVSFNPLKEFTEAIGKDKVNVITVIQGGIEPHDFEPKAKDLGNINSGKIFVYNGLEMEPWVDKVLESINNKEVILVDSSKGVNAIKSIQKEEGEDEQHGDYDPHIWLSLKEAKVQSNNIKEALIKADASNKDYYNKNYEEFLEELDNLYNEYKNKFDKVSNKKFVTGHAAFSYLCRDFNLEQNSIEGVYSEGEPSAKKLRELVDYAKKNEVKTIFAEENASPQVSNTLAREVGAKVEKIYSLEIKEDNKDYIQSMRDNLEKIYISLK